MTKNNYIKTQRENTQKVTIKGVLNAASLGQINDHQVDQLHSALEKGGLAKKDPFEDVPVKSMGLYDPNALGKYINESTFENREAYLTGIFATIGIRANSQQIKTVVIGLTDANIIKPERP